MVPGFCLLTMLWSAGFIELWQQREATLRHVWDMDEYAEHESERLRFRGTIATGVYTVHGHWVEITDSDLNPISNIALPKPRSLRASRLARQLRQLFAMSALLVMGFLCILTTLAIFAFRAYISRLAIGPYLAGALNAVAITALNTLFRNAALQLNEWENHRRSSSFTAALVYKMFIFQFINCYFSLFYIAFVKPYGVSLLFLEPQECKGALRIAEDISLAETCYDELQTQLMMIFLINLVIGNLNELISAQTGRIMSRMHDWLIACRRSALRKIAARKVQKGEPAETADLIANAQVTRRRSNATRRPRTEEPVNSDSRRSWPYALGKQPTRSLMLGASPKRTHPHVSQHSRTPSNPNTHSDTDTHRAGANSAPEVLIREPY
ncbi:calcium-activated chloride channel-domain-containing protein [Pavlovales sp. CCMP2436]|nr:calcium-activated chloride channel-domain-containing protein [Pavlovales sp. CCMP2436]